MEKVMKVVFGKEMAVVAVTGIAVRVYEEGRRG